MEVGQQAVFFADGNPKVGLLTSLATAYSEIADIDDKTVAEVLAATGQNPVTPIPVISVPTSTPTVANLPTKPVLATIEAVQVTANPAVGKATQNQITSPQADKPAFDWTLVLGILIGVIVLVGGGIFLARRNQRRRPG